MVEFVFGGGGGGRGGGIAIWKLGDEVMWKLGAS